MMLAAAKGPGPAEVSPADGRTAGGWAGALSQLSVSRARGGIRTHTLPWEPRGLSRGRRVPIGTVLCQIMPLSRAFAVIPVQAVSWDDSQAR